MAIGNPGDEAFTPIGPQAFAPDALPALLQNMVKEPNAAYPLGNGANHAHARMDIKEICHTINALAAEVGVMSVSELPDIDDARVGATYRLTANSNHEGILAPPGKYIYNSLGWVCVECYGMYQGTISGTVDVVLVPGAHYWFNVVGPVNSLNFPLTTTGPCYVYLLNPDEHDIADPDGVMTRTSEGILRLNSQRVEIQLMGLGFGVVWSCVDLQVAEEILPT